MGSTLLIFTLNLPSSQRILSRISFFIYSEFMVISIRSISSKAKSLFVPSIVSWSFSGMLFEFYTKSSRNFKKSIIMYVYSFNNTYFSFICWMSLIYPLIRLVPSFKNWRSSPVTNLSYLLIPKAPPLALLCTINFNIAIFNSIELNLFMKVNRVSSPMKS